MDQRFFFYQNEPLNDKKTKIIFHGFIEIVKESNHKSSTSWVDQGKWFYNNLILKVLDDNDILMDSNHNEDNSASDTISYLSYLKNLVR